MFRKAQHIDMAFRQVRLFCLVIVTACTIVTVFFGYRSYQLVQASQQRIYILANGKALEAFGADRKDNVPVEARDHVKMFHHYFFTLDPDEKVIQQHVTRALYFADGSAKQVYDNLQESGYYSQLISGNISQAVQCDSIVVRTDQYPYYFRYFGKQLIVRPTTVVTRRMLTEGFLRNVNRSDHNPHGFLIERWQTIDNTDLQTQLR